MKEWLVLELTVPGRMTDYFAAFLTDLAGSGVEVRPAADTGSETLITYLPADQHLPEKKERFLAFLAASSPAGAPFAWQENTIADEDWNANWKRHFKPERITARLIIKPTWEEYQAGPGEIVIEIDPKMAFGTGHHASTRLALQLIETVFAMGPSPAAVLDVGTGTGILAMAAAGYGAARVVATDNDPEAVAAAVENIAQNRLGQQVTASGCDLENVAGPFDLVLANIIHDTLLELAPALVAKIGEGGHLILAGILRGEQEASIVARYREHGLQAVEVRHQEEWAALLLGRSASRG
ncbi:MAG: 50S ribosomal protein L11 methyltransferase [Thermodesulfobacteriota bacterium]